MQATQHASIAKTLVPLKLAWQQVPRGEGGVTTYFFFSTFSMTQQTHVTIYYYFLTCLYDSLIQIHPEASFLYI
jgi:hypothetical protein